MNMNCEDQLDVVILSLKQLNLLDALSFLKKPTNADWKLTSRKRVWEFCLMHCVSLENPQREVRSYHLEKEYENFGLPAAHI